MRARVGIGANISANGAYKKTTAESFKTRSYALANFSAIGAKPSPIHYNAVPTARKYVR